MSMSNNEKMTCPIPGIPQKVRLTEMTSAGG